ncbi:AGE family epimerase/isomerase, partial [Mycobacterium tuberculosis]|nr:AGE family epimerase/isomerase [Mycobacterium tuberculosis]
GVPGCQAYAEHGVAALRGVLRDASYDGWFAHPEGLYDSGKAAYLHAFVAMAASSAKVAGMAGAEQLLEDAVGVIDAH